MQIEFEKWHGLGNDFIVVWLEPGQGERLKTIQTNAKKLCARDFGHIGADGILVCTASRNELFPQAVTIINADGSIAQNCGNGLRCVMGSVWKRSADQNQSIDPDEVVELVVEGRSFFGRYAQALPKEFLNPELRQISITMPTPEVSSWKQEFVDFVKTISTNIDVLGCYSIGNPHAILNYSGEKGQLYAAASKLQTFSCEGSTGINLHVISEHKPSTKNIKGLAELGHKDVWVWERGVGPTKACGSGACVVGAHSYLEMEAEFGQWVEIKMPGGLLWTRQKEASGEIELMGPAEMSFAGELYL